MNDDYNLKHKAEDNNNLWGSLFWIVVVVVGGYFLLFNSDNKAEKYSEVTTASPSPYLSPKFTVPSYTTPRYYTPPLTFRGYTCTQDCSGHEAGYEWAEENDIDNLDDCGGNSQSFIEGCEAYVEENYPENYYY